MKNNWIQCDGDTLINLDQIACITCEGQFHNIVTFHTANGITFEQSGEDLFRDLIEKLIAKKSAHQETEP